MSDATIGLRLEGEVSLSDFAEALTLFSELLDAVSEEIAGEKIAWRISRLEVGEDEEEA